MRNFITLAEEWATAFTPYRQNYPCEVFFNPSRREFATLTKQWGDGARALISTDGNLYFWHMDHALHSEAAQKLKKQFIPAHLILLPIGTKHPVLWNELENWLDDDDFSNDAVFRPGLRAVRDLVVTNPYIRALFGTVDPIGHIDVLGDSQVYTLSDEWFDAGMPRG